MTQAVGIDLGTTHTVVAHAPGGGAEVWPVPQLVSATERGARELLPSVLYAAADVTEHADPWREAPWCVGVHALARGREVPGRAVASAKSWLCHDAVDRRAPILPWGGEESAARLSPVEASARVLAHLVGTWDGEGTLADRPVVLTVPASFDAVARELTLEAAALAGLGTGRAALRLVEEPVAAFHAWAAAAGGAGVRGLLGDRERIALLVVDVGGGTTDLTLLSIEREGRQARVERVAVGRHLLLGGDNMDLALAHLVEPRLVTPPGRLDPRRFAQLVLACRSAKERLLAADAPDGVPIAVAGAGSSLVGGTLRATVSAAEVRQVVLDGFFPLEGLEAEPRRARVGLRRHDLPYEHDPAITRHVASFLRRHARDAPPSALLLNGGPFRAPHLVERVVEAVTALTGRRPEVLDGCDPDRAVALGAVEYGRAVEGGRPLVGGGSPRSYWVGTAARDGRAHAVCVVPRGAKEGARHRAAERALLLRVGAPARFELYASDVGHERTGDVVAVDPERLAPLPPVTASFAGAGERGEREVRVVVEGELSAVGTLELACVEATPRAGASPRRFRLAFEIRGPSSDHDADPATDEGPASLVASAAAHDSLRPPVAMAPAARRDEAQRGATLGPERSAIERAFAHDAPPRAVKELLRDLERALGERKEWSLETCRAVFDAVAEHQAARRRSPDHERVFWLLASFGVRPGFGHPLDADRVRRLARSLGESVAHPGEARSWEQLFIALRRAAGGLDERAQVALRDRYDPFLAPAEAGLKRPKGLKPLALDELLAAMSWLERVPAERRAELGGWVLERTWTRRDPRLWAALGRLGARVPTYASLHHVVAPRVVETWLDHLLRERWGELPTAARAAVQLARRTGDRARDVSDATRAEVARALERAGAPAAWVACVRDVVALEEAMARDFLGEDVPVGLRLAGGA
ncbi:MAG: Hsp70 family protein [Polyangiaceae bacterium]|nr:Hsp70 family protein [Polyangiaceae bacterium]